jgi:CTP:molybdopterin cytidylyltransferase MocA
MGKKIENFLLILLSGGQSSRMGTPKGLLNYCGIPWIVEQLRRFKAASGSRAIIVLGFHQAPYFEQIPWLEKAVNRPIEHFGLEILVAVNPVPEQGQFSSLQCAIASLKDNPSCLAELRTAGLKSPKSPNSELIPGAFVLPIDVPCPGKEVFEKLAGAFSDSIAAAIPRYQARGGHPVLLGGDFLSRLAKVPLPSPLARLDLQIQTLPQERVAFILVDDKNIGLNMNSMIEFQNFTQTEKSSFKA